MLSLSVLNSNSHITKLFGAIYVYLYTTFSITTCAFLVPQLIQVFPLSLPILHSQGTSGSGGKTRLVPKVT